MHANELTTYTRGDLTISSPDEGVVLKLATLAITAAPAIAASGIPAIGEYWPGEGGVNGGLFPGGEKPYYLIVPTGADAEPTLEWGGYGRELDGAKSPWDGQANTGHRAREPLAALAVGEEPATSKGHAVGGVGGALRARPVVSLGERIQHGDFKEGRFTARHQVEVLVPVAFTQMN